MTAHENTASFRSTRASGAAAVQINTASEDRYATLRTYTLYVPNYWYGPGGTMLPDEAEGSRTARYISDMISEYKFPVRLVRRDELSELILNTRKPLYYVNYVQSLADKMISVVNGLTGEVLYANFTGKSYRPKEKDFRDLNKVVLEAK
ncbi:hypothetical protein [Flaviaesturariibacter amylovorans]|uniref:hypothetical protein n=1 Tax=Flaviaesturariibacter amylovorans TaxID=1084520 RepID=UPI0031EEB911